MSRTIAPEAYDKISQEVDADMAKRANMIAKLLNKGRAYTESWVSAMELISQRAPGREAWTGEAHSYSDAFLQDGNRKATAAGKLMRDILAGQDAIFGGKRKANKVIPKWKSKREFKITKFVGKLGTSEVLPDVTNVWEALYLYQLSKQPDARSTFEAHGWEMKKKNGQEGRSVAKPEIPTT